MPGATGTEHGRRRGSRTRGQRGAKVATGWRCEAEAGGNPGGRARGRSAGGGTMVNPQMVMYEEEFNQIQNVVDRLVKDANAKVVFIVDKNGQLIAASGDVDNLDTTSLASLTAGN